MVSLVDWDTVCFNTRGVIFSTVAPSAVIILLTIGDYKIKCHQTFGDGYLTIAEGIERSCNEVPSAVIILLTTCGS